MIETHIFAQCAFSDFHFIFWHSSKWAGQALYCICFPFFYVFIFVFLKKRSKRECQCLDFWETCLLCVSGLWPVEEEVFSDIMSGHTAKLRFPFQKLKSPCVLEFEDSRENGTPPPAYCFRATAINAGNIFFFCSAKRQMHSLKGGNWIHFHPQTLHWWYWQSSCHPDPVSLLSFWLSSRLK